MRLHSPVRCPGGPRRPSAGTWEAVPRRLIGAAALFGLAALCVVSAFRVDAAVPEATVRIDNFTFSPAALTVVAGTKVTWVNGDDIPHTVVETNRAFRSKALDTEDTFSFTFKDPGEFSYFCSLHPHMTGTIVVKAGES